MSVFVTVINIENDASNVYYGISNLPPPFELQSEDDQDLNNIQQILPTSPQNSTDSPQEIEVSSSFSCSYSTSTTSTTSSTSTASPSTLTTLSTTSTTSTTSTYTISSTSTPSASTTLSHSISPTSLSTSSSSSTTQPSSTTTTSSPSRILPPFSKVNIYEKAPPAYSEESELPKTPPPTYKVEDQEIQLNGQVILPSYNYIGDAAVLTINITDAIIDRFNNYSIDANDNINFNNSTNNESNISNENNVNQTSNPRNQINTIDNVRIKRGGSFDCWCCSRHCCFDCLRLTILFLSIILCFLSALSGCLITCCISSCLLNRSLRSYDDCGMIVYGLCSIFISMLSISLAAMTLFFIIKSSRENISGGQIINQSFFLSNATNTSFIYNNTIV